MSQLAEHPEWFDAAVDALRVDAEDRSPTEFILPDVQDWPVSFGVLPDEQGRAPLLRLRAFRVSRGEPSLEAPVDEPDRALTIDRLVDLGSSPDGVVRVRVTLDLGCVGELVQYGNSPSTCVDQQQLAVSPDRGIGDDPGGDSVAGSFFGLLSAPCKGSVQSGRVCISGGYAVLGDRRFTGWGKVGDYVSSTPPRPVMFSSFWMDRTEYTVGRLRDVLASGKYSGPLPKGPVPASQGFEWCTWDSASDDALPLNCLNAQLAEALCEVDGGKLPTEAQWEYVARGRGRGLIYPWGDDPPSCCDVAASRGHLCTGAGPKPVGEKTAESCPVLRDRSVDDVLDLAGNVGELVRGDFLTYDHSCWRESPTPLDPLCDDPQLDSAGTRGGDWESGLAVVAAPLRLDGQVVSHWEGFRCVYENVP